MQEACNLHSYVEISTPLPHHAGACFLLSHPSLGNSTRMTTILKDKCVEVGVEVFVGF